jgi:hypothetical protein
MLFDGGTQIGSPLTRSSIPVQRDFHGAVGFGAAAFPVRIDS